MNNDILINKNNLLSENYIPKNLYQTDNNENNFHEYNNPNLKPLVKPEIMPYFLLLRENALKEGYNIIVDSGYRSYSYQKIIYDNMIKEKGKDAKSIVAYPGSSEHQSGLCFDIAYIRNGKFDGITKENDKEILWLINNSYKYGFILRYPKGKENITQYNYEPWHYRFVGIKLAMLLNKYNLTLEEYYENKLKYEKILNEIPDYNFLLTSIIEVGFVVLGYDYSNDEINNFIKYFQEKYPNIKIINSKFENIFVFKNDIKNINLDNLKLLTNEFLLTNIKEYKKLERKLHI